MQGAALLEALDSRVRRWVVCKLQAQRFPASSCAPEIADPPSRPIGRVLNKDNKLVWPEAHDYLQGKRRFKSDLIPKPLLVASHFAQEQTAIDATRAELEAQQAQLTDLEEEHSGEEAVFSGFDSITAVAVKERLRELGGDDDACADELTVLKQWQRLADTVAALKKQLREAEAALASAGRQRPVDPHLLAGGSPHRRVRAGRAGAGRVRQGSQSTPWPPT